MLGFFIGFAILTLGFAIFVNQMWRWYNKNH